MIRKLIISGSALIMTVMSLNADAACLKYDPAIVTLNGKLKRLTFPGPPNYESVAEGDEAETGYYLALSNAICTAGDPESIESYPQQGVKLVQLVLDSTGYKKLKPYLGANIRLRGTLFASYTGHHHAPLLLQDIKFLGN